MSEFENHDSLDEYQPRTIQCIDAITSAWDRMMGVLFRPFEAAKWFVIGFCAWLANLGEGWDIINPQDLINLIREISSSEGNQNFGGRFVSLMPDTLLNVQGAPMAAAGVFMFLLFTVAILVGVTIGLAIAWLKSRGDFMFLDNLVRDEGRVLDAWKETSQMGNSAFIFRLVLGIVILIVMALVTALFAGVVALLGWDWVQQCVQSKRFIEPTGSAIGAMVVLGLYFLLIFATTIVSGSFFHLFKCVTIPVMYKKRINAMAGTRIVWGLFKQDPWAFIRYLLIRAILGSFFYIFVPLVGILTCCGYIILMIPYLWTVLTLPVLALLRFYGVEFLGQFGDEFRLDSFSDWDDELPEGGHFAIE